MVSEYNNPRNRKFYFIIAIIFVIVTLIPMYVLIIIAFAVPSQTVAAYYPPLFPSQFTLSNFIGAFSGYSSILQAAFIKSLITATIVGALAVVLGFHASYGLSKMSNRMSALIISVLFFSTMIPSLTIAIPISVSFLKLGLYDSALGLALAQELVVLPMTVFMITGTLQSLPKQLELQARVDGAGFMQSLYTVILPLAKPGIFAAFLLSWMMSWDEFTFAVILSPVHPTLPILIYIDSTARGNILFASAFALLVTIPVIIITLVLSKFIKGNYLTSGVTG